MNLIFPSYNYFTLFRRQVVARNILDTIRSVADDAEDFENVLNLISRLADDREPSVRSELMEQVQQNSLP